MVDFHDPRASVAVQSTPYRLSIDLVRLNDPCVAFLANGFPDSQRFLERLAEAMRKRLPQLSARILNKGDASSPAPAALLTEIQEHCQAAVAAYGH